MSISRRLARPLLAATFVADGLDALRNPHSHVDRVERVTPLLATAGVPRVITADPTLLVRAGGAVTAVAGLMLATNRKPRTAAVVLAAVQVPLLVANNPVWAARDRDERKSMRRDLVRGASLLGGLLFAGLDRDGKPSLSWRAATRREQRHELREARAKD